MTPRQIEVIGTSRRAGSTVTFDSPIHGTVVAKKVQEGQYVDEGMQMFQLVDLSKVWAYLDIYEKDMRFIRLGQPVAITADSYPDESFNGRVAFIDPAFDSQTRTARVRVELDNGGGRLRPQMFVRAEIRIPLPNCTRRPRVRSPLNGKARGGVDRGEVKCVRATRCGGGSQRRDGYPDPPGAAGRRYGCDDRRVYA